MLAQQGKQQLTLIAQVATVRFQISIEILTEAVHWDYGIHENHVDIVRQAQQPLTQALIILRQPVSEFSGLGDQGLQPLGADPLQWHGEDFHVIKDIISHLANQLKIWAFACSQRLLLEL